MSFLKKTNLIASTTLALLAAQSVSAAEFLIRGGAHYFSTDADDFGLEVDDSITVTTMLTYLFTDNLGIELLGGIPIQYDIDSQATGNEIGEVKALPPALSAIYRFQPTATIRPYVGAGLHYTFFYDEESAVPPLPGEIELDNEFGFLAIAGVDYMIGNTWFLNFDVRWFDKDPDLRVGNTDVGSLDFSPLAIGIMVGRQFSW